MNVKFNIQTFLSFNSECLNTHTINGFVSKLFDNVPKYLHLTRILRQIDKGCIYYMIHDKMYDIPYNRLGVNFPEW